MGSKTFFTEIQPDLAYATAPFLGSQGPGEGPKGQISLNLNYKVNFKDFFTKLCVSSHI